MNLYRDDVYGITITNTKMRVFIYSKENNTLVDTLSLIRTTPLSETVFVPYANPDCASISTSIRTETLKYSNNIKLSNFIYNNLAGYYVIWQSCCRNSSASNIINPSEAGQVFYLEFPPISRQNQAFINSSPQFTSPLSDFACINDNSQFDFSSQDPDGDSLVYSMVTPLNGFATITANNPTTGSPAPYPPITWKSGYSANNPINGSVPLQIDAQTGILKLNSNQTGLFVFAIKCEEYRNGKYIGQIRRDYQLLVKDCLPNNAPVLQNTVTVDGENQLISDTIRIRTNENQCINLKVQDKPLGSSFSQKLTIKAKAVNFDPGIFPFNLSPTTGFTTSLNNILNASICFKKCNANYNQGGVFFIDVTATDDGCNVPKSVTNRLIFKFDPNKRPVSKLISLKIARNGDAISNNSQYFNAYPQDTIHLTFMGLDINKKDQLQVKGWVNDSLTIPNLGLSMTAQNNNNPLLVNILWPINCELIRNKPYKLSFVFSDNGCTSLFSDTVNFWITIQDSADTDYTRYNITTPNDDGKNDVFILPDLPPDNCYNQFVSIDIYNRWGVKVFSDTRRSFIWDAKKFAGGTYFYGIRYTHKKYRGWVEVLH